MYEPFYDFIFTQISDQIEKIKKNQKTRSAQRNNLFVVEAPPRPQSGLVKRTTTEPTPTSPPPNVVQGKLACYTCRLDFRGTNYNASHHCLSREKMEIDDRYLVWCNEQDVYCKVRISAFYYILNKSNSNT